ncbi:acid sphingomyelinase-like phosphodiesterase 3b isoform X2 [Venturia canescens]|uniref:acid sphingomyelinase-like phosphodiesterase 3b isoform X2 n=1 Tax=Venturia canescens TaxID=32260 RepID=UPI001C9C1801|nr:acid sphingomyelinase-like phosphodiesterase 3b isoform X2 [Venturia canescens]
MIRDYLILLSWLCAVHGRIGYFWHITDIHYDPRYSAQRNANNMCWNARSNVESGRPRQDRRTPGIFGDYNCDSPWALIESAAKAMKSKHSEGIEFVLWTGDALSHSDKMSKELRLQCLKNLTDLLSRTFSEQFVFPALGHEDVGLSLKEIATLWKHWLPTDALQTFEKTGFYTIEQTTENYRIIFLNTNLWLETETGMDNRVNDQRSGSGVSVGNDNSDDPHGQWTWFDSTLRTARKKKEANILFVQEFTKVGETEESRKRVRRSNLFSYSYSIALWTMNSGLRCYLAMVGYQSVDVTSPMTVRVLYDPITVISLLLSRSFSIFIYLGSSISFQNSFSSCTTETEISLPQTRSSNTVTAPASSCLSSVLLCLCGSSSGVPGQLGNLRYEPFPLVQVRLLAPSGSDTFCPYLTSVRVPISSASLFILFSFEWLRVRKVFLPR